jgi:DNA-binding response OmpR family regulator
MTHIVEDLKHKPYHYYDVETARECLAEITPDLFIIDMHIEDSMNATKALIRDLRKKKKLKVIPILIISAFVTKEEITNEFPGFDPDNVIVKPANAGVISDRIKKLLKAKK